MKEKKHWFKAINFKKIKTKFKSISLGKKIFSTMWLVTGILLFTMIGLFIGTKEKYGGNIKTHSQNYADKVRIIETVPEGVLTANRINDETYYVQATDFYDWNGDGKYTKDEDIIPNVFYPISTVREVPRSNDQVIFNFSRNHFHRQGYGWPIVPIKKQVSVTLKQSDGSEYTKVYSPGDTIELKKVYDAKEYDPKKGDVAQGDVADYLSNFEINNIEWRVRTSIAPGKPYHEVQGYQAYDVERQIDKDKDFPKDIFLDRDAFKESGIYFRPSESAKKIINLLNGFGLVLLISLIATILTTVGVVVYEKKQKTKKKGVLNNE